MRRLPRILELLPPPYSIEPDSMLARFLDAIALELEAIDEDVDRLRQTHWVDTAYRLHDLEKLGRLVGVAREEWETLPTYRARLVALVKAFRQGALGPGPIREFVHDYVRRSERALDSTFVPGLTTLTLEEAYTPPEDRPLFAPLELVENPEGWRRSSALAARRGRVPYLFRFTEEQRGLEESVPRFAITGFPEGRTCVPILVNRTTHELIGFRGTVPMGRTLVIEAIDEERTARATLDEHDVTDRLFSLREFDPASFGRLPFDETPRLPRLARGRNDWAYLSAGFYDLKGLDRFFFAIANDRLRPGVFDETAYDEALFPDGPVARLSMTWTEIEGASFEVRVPRRVVIESRARAEAMTARPHQRVAEGLRRSIDKLHAAGVRARVKHPGFRETQPIRDRFRPSWMPLDPERADPAIDRDLGLGARFGESDLDEGRFE